MQNLQLSLFEAPKATPQQNIKGCKRCRDCKFMTRNNWNPNLKYCTLQRGYRKITPFKKIKATDKACFLFQEKPGAKLFIQK